MLKNFLNLNNEDKDKYVSGCSDAFLRLTRQAHEYIHGALSKREQMQY